MRPLKLMALLQIVSDELRISWRKKSQCTEALFAKQLVMKAFVCLKLNHYTNSGSYSQSADRTVANTSVLLMFDTST